ncbi:MAG: hypothetical protein ACFFAS_05850 [Promethearchaeota archaeon]
MDFIPFKRWAIFIVYAVLFLIITFNPGEVTANKDSNWAPIIDLTFLLFFFVIMFIAVVPLYIFIFKILSTFNEKVMRNRWKVLIIGISELIFFFCCLTFSNYLNIEFIRITFSALALLFLPTGCYLMYYAVARKYIK